MSTYTLNTNNTHPSSVVGSPNIEQQPKLLEEALAVVKLQGFQMRKNIENDQLYDAFKFASTMLAELRTSQLLPKYYYELYMAIFDELRYLMTYLYDVHVSGKHNLADLYELVQYATNIVPRLYLMMTVGSVYMRASKEAIEKRNTQTEGRKMAPVKEIMKDMLEMSRGVQHATRGLFLRYYLSGVARDYLPDCESGEAGTIHDSIFFILQNFIEMNKLWVRLQHQGHSRDRDRREQERRELRLLVGSNLVRLSQLEETTLEMFQSSILPSLLEEIVSCRDVIAQEYLLDVIIQAFPDEFHLRCLDMYLAAVSRLHPSVNVKNIVISLIDRFSGYAARAREEHESKAQRDGTAISGIPEDVELFEVFWEQITDLMVARPEFTLEDTIALMNSLNGLALNCYPKRLEYIDRVFGMVKLKVSDAIQADAEVMKLENTKQLLTLLLLGPIEAYQDNLLTVINFPSGSSSVVVEGHTKSNTLGGHYSDVLFLQSFGVRRQVAHAAAKAAVKAFTEKNFTISTVYGVNFFLGEICSIMVRDQIDGNLFGSKKAANAAENDFKDEKEGPFDWDDAVEEQILLAQLVHVIKTRDGQPQQEFLILSTAKDHFKESGDIRIRFVIEPVVNSLVRTASKLKEESDKPVLKDILNGIHATIRIFSLSREYYAEDEDYAPLFEEERKGTQSKNRLSGILANPADISLSLYLLGAQVASLTNEEEMCYEFFVEAFTVYEESISESKAQLQAIIQIISALQKVTVFGFENYETLITKCTVHCSRLLKRADQCRGVMYASRLFWSNDTLKRSEDKPAYRDSKRVLECLQKSLKIADSVMDPVISVGLFVEILEQYLWYFQNKCDAITSNYINSLIELIQNNLANPVRSTPFKPSLGGPLGAPPRPTQNQNSKKLLETASKHFINIVKYITLQKEETRRSLTSIVPDMDHGFQNKEGRWADITIPNIE